MGDLSGQRQIAERPQSAQTRLTSSAFGSIGFCDGAAQCDAPFRRISLPMRQDQARAVLPPNGVPGLRTIGGLTLIAVARKETRSCVSEPAMAPNIAVQSHKSLLRSRVDQRRACCLPRLILEQTGIALTGRVLGAGQCISIPRSILIPHRSRPVT
jgi:hypothetical protein